MKTKLQLEEELRVLQCLKTERDLSDKLYAIKMVEKIVFGMVGLILVAIVGAVIGLIFK